MSNISLAQAQAALTAAIAEARTLELKPVTVAILDGGGHLVALAREDGCSNLRPKIAIAKASGALSLGISSRAIGEMAQDRPTFVASAANIAPDGMIPAAGGILLYSKDAEVIGAIGVTGDTSDNDELCAMAGLTATSFNHAP